ILGLLHVNLPVLAPHVLWLGCILPSFLTLLGSFCVNDERNFPSSLCSRSNDTTSCSFSIRFKNFCAVDLLPDKSVSLNLSNNILDFCAGELRFISFPKCLNIFLSNSRCSFA